MSSGRTNEPEGATSGADGSLETWYDERLEELLEKPAHDLRRELSGLVEQLAEIARETDDTREVSVGVSFTGNGTCLDYSVHRVVEPEGRVETVKDPVSESHRYVRFAHPPDPNVDAGAIRGRLVDAIERERRANREAPSGLADVWEQL